MPVRAAFQVVGLRPKSNDYLSSRKNEEGTNDTPQSYSDLALSFLEDE